MNRAKTFYEKTLEVTFEKLASPGLEMWTFPFNMDAPGAAGAPVKVEGNDSGSGGPIIYFSCGDCAAEAGRAAQHGRKFSIGDYGFIAFVEDTEGNVIGPHSIK